MPEMGNVAPHQMPNQAPQMGNQAPYMGNQAQLPMENQAPYMGNQAPYMGNQAQPQMGNQAQPQMGNQAQPQMGNQAQPQMGNQAPTTGNVDLDRMAREMVQQGKNDALQGLFTRYGLNKISDIYQKPEQVQAFTSELVALHGS